jgi:O-antigen/teichoic acid export membrane protein
MGFLMRSRLLWRRSVTAVGTYSSAVVGFLGTVVAAHAFSTGVLGLFTIVVAATGFFQMLLDLTVEEAVIKYGFRYEAQRRWGRLRRLYGRAFAFKASGDVLAAAGLVGLAFAAESLFGDSRLRTPLLVAAALPLVQSMEGLAGTALILRSRYDVRAVFLLVSAALRLAGIVVGSRFGLTETIMGIVAGQAASTAAIGAAGLYALGRFPRAAHEPLGEDRNEIVRFVLQSSLATGVVSLRGTFAPLLLGLVTSPVQVGFFRVAAAPQSGFATLSAPARMVLLTEQTRDWERGRRGVVFRGVRRYTVAGALCMAAILPPLLVFMPDVVRVLFSPKNVGATDAARVLLFAAALQFVFGWAKSFPVSIGRPNLRVWTHGLETVVLIPLVLALGAAYGATGAAVAVVAATAVWAGFWAVLFVRIERAPGGGAPPGEPAAAVAPEDEAKLVVS